LRHDNPRINAAALAVYLTADREEALKYLQSMMRNQQNVVRLHALSLTPLLDFATVEPMLINFVQREISRDLLSQASYLLAATPSLDGLWAIWSATHDHNGKDRIGMGEVWKQALETAQSARPDVDFATAMTTRFEQETARQQKPAPEYSYSKIAPRLQPTVTGTPTVEEKSLGEIIAAAFVEQRWTFATILFMLLPLGYFAFTATSQPDVTPKGTPNIRLLGMGNRDNQSSQTTQGGLRSNTSDVLGNTAYARLIKNAEAEQETFRKESAQKRREVLAFLAGDSSAPSLTRLTAGLYLNESIFSGLEALEKNELDAAKEQFKRTLHDPEANPLAKMIPCG